VPPAAAAAPPEAVDDPAAQQRWEGVVGELQKQQTARFFRLAYSKVVAVGGGVIRISVASRNALAELTRPETRAMIEAAIEREYGRCLRFEPVSPDDAGKGGEPRAESVSLERQGREDPLVRMSVEVLQGRVEGVVARRRREGS